MSEHKHPDWMDKNPSEWPAGAREFWLIMANAAERRLAKRNANPNTNSLPSAG